MPSDVQALLRQEVEAVVAATWPEVSVVLMSHQAERRAYQNVRLPFAVMAVGAGAEEEFGIGNVYLVREISFHYIRKWHDQAEDVVRDKIGLLKRAMLAASFPLSQATLFEVEDDTTPESALNQTLVAKNLELIGGTLKGRFGCGETAF